MKGAVIHFLRPGSWLNACTGRFFWSRLSCPRVVGNSFRPFNDLNCGALMHPLGLTGLPVHDPDLHMERRLGYTL